MITKEQTERLVSLRERIRPYMKERRLSHTLAVEREAAALAKLYAPEDEFILRCAALLHDITKELSLEKQLQLCEESAIIYTHEETLTPKIFHSRTAPAIIKRDFAEFADEKILSAVRWHTTGRAGMSIHEIILFLADFIEDTRTFESCIELRRFFYGGLENAADERSRMMHLYDTMILAFDMTVRELTDDSVPIHLDTVAARNYFITKRGLKIEFQQYK